MCESWAGKAGLQGMVQVNLHDSRIWEEEKRGLNFEEALLGIGKTRVAGITQFEMNSCNCQNSLEFLKSILGVSTTYRRNAGV